MHLINLKLFYYGIQLHVQTIICYSIKLSFECHQSRPNMQNTRMNAVL